MKILKLYLGEQKNNLLIDFTHDSKNQNRICLTGVNGCGKTSVLTIIYDLINMALIPKYQPIALFNSENLNLKDRFRFIQLDILEPEDRIISIIFGDSKNIEYSTEYKHNQIIYTIGKEIDLKINNNTSIYNLLKEFSTDDIKKLETFINKILIDKTVDLSFNDITIGDNNLMYQFQDLGDGEKELINKCVNVFYMLNNYNMVLIDDIEKNLHPEYQSNFIYYLNQLISKDTQLIVTSMSSVVFKSWPDHKGLIDLSQLK